MSLETSSAGAETSNRTNLLPPPGRPLHNVFFALRHGQSQANCLGIIASNPEIACHQYGLSELGQQQARNAGQAIVQHYYSQQQKQPDRPYDGLAVISSDLLRCRETATLVVQEILAAGSHTTTSSSSSSSKTKDIIPLYKGAIVYDTRLRERNFGDLDGTSDANYAKVWEMDAVDSSAISPFQAEAVDQVMRRATELVTEYDALLHNHMIVLTAHGDVLQILQTAFASLPGTQHRTLPHLETATLRLLERKK